jgi:hypothetical protein
VGVGDVPKRSRNTTAKETQRATMRVALRCIVGAREKVVRGNVHSMIGIGITISTLEAIPEIDL